MTTAGTARRGCGRRRARRPGWGRAAGQYGGGVPSYRVRLAVGVLRPGADPADVLPAAVAAAREHTAVEAGDIDVVRGVPRVTVRFEAPDDLAAADVARIVVDRTEQLVDVDVSRVTRRYGARWYGLR